MEENWYPAENEYDPGITKEQWKEFVTDRNIFTEDSLIAFACIQKSTLATCTDMAEEFGRTKNFYNNAIWRTGEKVHKLTNCPLSLNPDETECFWSICCLGRKMQNGRIELKIRPELEEAFDETGVLKGIEVMEKRFTWIPFYTELAKKLLEFKNNRSDLVKIVYELDEKYVSFIHNKDRTPVSDIDFFSFFSIFNRGTSDENRKIICNSLKKKLNLSADIPLNFDGIPTMDNRLSTFYSRETANEQIPLLCSLFEAVFNNDFALIEKFFDKALGFKGTKWNITMGLYWISPYDYISLDSRNRDYLKKSGINIFDEKELNGKNYLIFLEEIKNCIQERKLKEKSIPEISYNAWKNPDNSKGEEIMPDNSLADNLTELLKHTHNLILHGAPGTGKTFLAKQIAERMDCSPNEIGFVQFHPSYDYTDFVEGLRPKNQAGGEIGFERKDGVFKEFCKRALQNLIDSKKSVEVLEKEISINDKVENFLEKAIEEKSEFETATGNKFTIIENAEKNIFVSIPANEKTSELSLPKNDLIQLLNSENKIESGADIKSFFNRKWRTQQDSYIWILYKEINSLKQNVNVQKIEKIQEKNFLFIIDEINRGELSKIFGELFFCIDPGYRGKENGTIKTQYQNLIEKGDEFYDGFFVPENVYIIGTMNDIDRSVDTMDFAFRRRFAFKEIKASENLEMFDELGEIAGEAKTRLTKLNEEISKITELSSPSSYHIGGSYFLKLKDFEGDSNERFQKLWEYHLEVLLKEYLRGTENAEENFAKLKKAYFLNQNQEETKDFF